MKFNRRQTLEACNNVEIVHVDASLTTACSFHINDEDLISEPITYTAPIYVAEIHAAFLGLQQILNHAIVNSHSKQTAYQLFTDNSIVYFMFNKGRAQLKHINSKFIINLIVFFTLIYNLINIEVFFVPSADNLADQFTRLRDKFE